MPQPVSPPRALVYGILCASLTAAITWFILKRYEELWNSWGVVIVCGLAFLGFIAGVALEIRAHGKAVAKFKEGYRGPEK
jgi:hypothetical protein